MFLCCRFLLTRAKISQKKEMKMHYQGKVQIFGISGNREKFGKSGNEGDFWG